MPLTSRPCCPLGPGCSAARRLLCRALSDPAFSEADKPHKFGEILTAGLRSRIRNKLELFAVARQNAAERSPLLAPPAQVRGNQSPRDVQRASALSAPRRPAGGRAGFLLGGAAVCCSRGGPAHSGERRSRVPARGHQPPRFGIFPRPRQRCRCGVGSGGAVSPHGRRVEPPRGFPGAEGRRGRARSQPSPPPGKMREFLCAGEHRGGKCSL